jgi:Zn-finger protein
MQNFHKIKPISHLYLQALQRILFPLKAFVSNVDAVEAIVLKYHPSNHKQQPECTWIHRKSSVDCIPPNLQRTLMDVEEAIVLLTNRL